MLALRQGIRPVALESSINARDFCSWLMRAGQTLGHYNCVTELLRSHAELRALVILLCRTLDRVGGEGVSNLLLSQAEAVLRAVRAVTAAAAEHEESRDSQHLNALEDMLDTPGSDLLIDHTDEGAFAITSSQDVEGATLRDALDQLIRLELLQRNGYACAPPGTAGGSQNSEEALQHQNES